MSLNMFHSRHWRYYEAYYNNSTRLGQQLVQAQKEHFDNEGMGVRVLSEQYKKIVINLDNQQEADIMGSVMRFSGTSLNDWIDSQFVVEKSIRGCCLWSELDNFIYSGRKLESFSESEQLSFEGYCASEGFTPV